MKINCFYRIFLLNLLFVSLNSYAVGDTTSVEKNDSWKFKFSAEISPQVYYDTRQVLSAREDELLFYPLPVVMDSEGNDLNAQPSLNMLAITSRLGLKIQSPDVLGAKTTGFLEADFSGSTNSGINMFRLRHAYVNMEWRTSELLVGQYWTPLVLPEIMPGTRPLNMGVPFHPYSRYVQARFLQHIGDFELIGVAAFQLDNKSSGPDGMNTQYLRHSCIPELTLQLRYNTDRVFVGAAYNLLVLQPRAFVVDSLSNTYKTNTKFASHAFSVFGKYNFNKWAIKMQSVLGDNMDAHLLMGGYAESPLDYITHEYKYEPYGCLTAWVDFGRTAGKWRPGIFCGYAKNTGFKNAIDNDWNIYGRGIDIDFLWRVQPRIGFYPTDFLNVFAEIEYTVANYGENPDKHYHYNSSHSVANTRFVLSLVYFFNRYKVH